MSLRYVIELCVVHYYIYLKAELEENYFYRALLSVHFQISFILNAKCASHKLL